MLMVKVLLMYILSILLMDLLKEFGLSAENIEATVKKVLGK